MPSTATARLSVFVRNWPSSVDGAVDGVVVFFALWTLWYQVALAAQFDLRPSGWPAAVVALVLVVAGAMRAARAGATAAVPAASPADDRLTAAGWSHWRHHAAVLVGLVLLVVAVVLRDNIGVLPTAVLAIALIALAAAPTVLGRGSAARDPAAVVDPPRQVEHLLAALASLGAGALALFLFKTDADDAYYVNRAAWVAEHGTAALDDTMFGPGTYPQAFGGGLPTPSIEALQGVVAALLHVEGGTVAYLLYAPVMAVVFVWVTWRLVRVWAPRRWGLVLAAALLFALASGGSIVGGYSIGRIWQGKVTAYAVLIPLVWTYLSHVVTAPTRRVFLSLVTAGIAFVGLTTSSALLAPVIGGAALLAALALRSRPLALGAVAFLVGPVVNGVVQMFGSATIGTQANGVTTDRQVFAIAYGSTTAMVVLAVAATVLAPGIARRPVGVVAGAAGLVTMAVFLPGVIDLADALTGAGPVVWRLAITAPTWVLVGLLVAAPAPGWLRLPAPWRARAGLGVLAAALLAVVAVTVGSGRWLWSPEAGARLTSSPTWKVDQAALADVRAARRLDVAPGLWLLPRVQMENLSISTAGPYAVVPRVFYLSTLDAPAQEVADRRVLLALANGSRVPRPAVANVRGALQRLDVSLACVGGDSPRAQRVLSEAVGEELQQVGRMRCHVRPPT